ncbi:MAG: hypothetical protein HY465_02865, partial [Deltaproteobacteria bacterium]|nr:hypothetical protein [Deltaproteobacteria bacterium]
MNKVLILLGIVGSMLFVTPLLLADEEEGVRVQYKVGDGLSVGDGSNFVHLQGRVQGRYTYLAVDGGSDTSTFSVPRAELQIDGFTLERTLKFFFQMNMASTNAGRTTTVCAPPACATTTTVVSNTTGLAVLNDYYIDWVPTPLFGIQAGQFKVPFLIQQLTSSTKQQFVDRSILSTSSFFDLGRDIGGNIHGALFQEHLRYAVFVLNGDGVNNFNRNDRAMMTGVRLEVPLLGTYEYTESDTSHSLAHNLGFGLAYDFNEGSSALQAGTIAAFTKTHHGTVDIGYKYRGFSVQTAAVASRTLEGASLTNWGYNGQIGVFVVPKIVEVAGRAAGTLLTGVTNRYEYVAGFNFFPKGIGHGIKFQTDYSFLMNSQGTPNQNDHQFRVAVNVVF